MDVLSTINGQIKGAEADLASYRPTSVDWQKRATFAAECLTPWLIEVAPGMKDFVQDVLNAPVRLRSMWSLIRAHVNLPREQIEAFDRQLTLDDVLRESVTGEVVSNVVTKYLLEHHPARALKSNGRSDYPDIYLSTLDYSALSAIQAEEKGNQRGRIRCGSKDKAKTAGSGS